MKSSIQSSILATIQVGGFLGKFDDKNNIPFGLFRQEKDVSKGDSQQPKFLGANGVSGKSELNSGAVYQGQA